MPTIGVTVIGLSELRKMMKGLPPYVHAQMGHIIARGANNIRNTAIKMIMEGGKSGREYKRGGKVHVASAPGEAPASDTGNLASNIFIVKDDSYGWKVYVGPNAPYGAALELGTRDGRIKPRPFLRPALLKEKPIILESIRKAIRDARKKG